MRKVMTGLVAFAFVSTALISSSFAQGKERRVAFVIGNSTYAAGALPTAANDAGLIAQTLQAAGFDVVGARDLDAETLRQSYGDFLKRLSSGGPDTVAFIYIAGYGLQYGNENYIVPIGATVARDLDIPIEAIRLNDLIAPLAGLNLKARFAVFDAAYPTPFGKSGAPLAGGLALVDASPGSLIAYNAAPGTVAPVAKGNYGPYAQALAATMREGGLAPLDLFDRVRLRVNQATKGAEVPWDSARIDGDFRFFDRGSGAPQEVATADRVADLRTKPIRDFAVTDAYNAALDRDTLGGYEEFLTAYGRDPSAKRIRALLAARREAITWHRSTVADTPNAYWSYLKRYPRGPHANDARLRLQAQAASFDPPPSFAAIAYDVPPPPPDEFAYTDRPVVYFDDPRYDFPPPPPPPAYYLPPVPAAFLDLGPPPPPDGLFFLPSPAFVPLPDYINPPVYVYAPQNNVFYGGAGDRGGAGPGAGFAAIHQPLAAAAPGQGNALRNAAIGAGVAAAVALPAAAVLRGAALNRSGITTPTELNRARAEGRLGALNRNAAPNQVGTPAAQALPGANGRPLPPANPREGRAPASSPPAVAPNAQVNTPERAGAQPRGAAANPTVAPTRQPETRAPRAAAVPVRAAAAPRPAATVRRAPAPRAQAPRAQAARAPVPQRAAARPAPPPRAAPAPRAAPPPRAAPAPRPAAAPPRPRPAPPPRPAAPRPAPPHPGPKKPGEH